MLQDVRFALRQLTRHRTYAAVAVLTIALGVGAIQLKFTTDERTLVEDLVRALFFSNPLARQMHYSFRPERKGRFLGNVYFLPGWMPAK